MKNAKINSTDMIIKCDCNSYIISLNEIVTPELINSMTEDEIVQLLTAQNENTSPEILKDLSDHSQKSILYYVAYNKNTPQDVLSKLSKSDLEEIRYAVANNKKTSDEILDRLANDNLNMIKIAVVLNKNTSTKTQDKLLGDVDEVVRKAAKSILKKREKGIL